MAESRPPDPQRRTQKLDPAAQDATDAKQDGTVILSEAQQDRVVKEAVLRRQFGAYEILGKLGEGGMGIVYKAFEKALNRMVALKVLVPGEHATPDQIQRFIMEAKAAARLTHPNIVPVYEFGAIEGRHYFTMKYVEGGTLDALIAKDPTTLMKDPRKTAAVFVEIAEGIAYAHGEKIIHRDLKPSNILMDRHTGRPLVMDFGLAKDMTDTHKLTKSGIALGTPCYMSPEAARGETRHVDQRSDVFSLGAILYEMLTGKPPFLGETFYDTMQKVVSDDPEPVRKRNPLVPVDLETICLKALEKGRINRYGSAADLAADLRKFLEDEPISARAISGVERASRRLRKHLRAVLIVGTLLLALLGSSAYYFIRLPQIRIEEAERERKTFVLTSVNQSLAYVREQQYGKAIALLEQVLARYPDAGEARRALDAAQAEFRQQVQELLQAGRRLLTEGNRAEAAARFTRAKELEPDNAEIAGLLELATGDTGLLDIVATPPAAAIRVAPIAGADLTVGPLGEPASGTWQRVVARGGYLLQFEAEGYATLRVPVIVGRLGEATAKVESHVRVEMVARDRVPAEMVVVWEGPCWLGGLGAGAEPQREVVLPTFLIDRREVSNADYARFVAETGSPAPRHWEGGRVPAGSEDLPVGNVSYEEASRYAEWAGKRIPTAAEWEKAARGIDGRKYPWGQNLVADRVVAGGLDSAVAVTRPTEDLSPYGCEHMAGNVAEWTSDPWIPDAPEGDRLIKGASYATEARRKGADMLALATRQYHAPARVGVEYVGFRCARDLTR